MHTGNGGGIFFSRLNTLFAHTPCLSETAKAYHLHLDPMAPATTNTTVYLTIAQEEQIYTTVTNATDRLLDLVVAACRGQMGITDHTVAGDIRHIGLVVTAGTTSYNASYVTDPLDTAGYYAEEERFVHVNVRTFADHKRTQGAEQNNLWDTQIAAAAAH